MNAETRVMRNLAHLTRFRLTSSTSELAARLGGLVLRQGEQLLGYYENDLGQLNDTIAVTDSGLHLFQAGGWVSVAYRDIEAVKTPPNKVDAWELEITLSSGKAIVLPVRGGEGKFRDAFAFLTFLDRVGRDLKKAEGGRKPIAAA